MKLKELFSNEYLFPGKDLKEKLYIMIFGTDTMTGKAFDVVLMMSILLSVCITIFDSIIIQELGPIARTVIIVLESFFTVFFTFEYVARIYCSPQPRKYVLSFFGIVDLLSILPFYAAIVFSGARYFSSIRVFRLIRVFRVFKLFNFLEEGNLILRSLHNSMRKILVFFLFVIVLVVALGSLMFAIEGGEGTDFENIPQGIYWAIVTITTVGYGDIVPHTAMGQILSSIVMLIGFTIIAVPTGIVSASIATESRKLLDGEDVTEIERQCPSCGCKSHSADARFCKNCGAKLPEHKKSAESLL